MYSYQPYQPQQPYQIVNLQMNFQAPLIQNNYSTLFFPSYNVPAPNQSTLPPITPYSVAISEHILQLQKNQEKIRNILEKLSLYPNLVPEAKALYKQFIDTTYTFASSMPTSEMINIEPFSEKDIGVLLDLPDEML